MTDLNQYLAANGYATLEDWGRDSDYFQAADGSWVDENNEPVDLYAQWVAAMESQGVHTKRAGMFCHDERHDEPCLLPCDACADECDQSTWREHEVGPSADTRLIDPETGQPTPVSVRVFRDAVFIAYENGGTFVNVEVITNSDGTQVVRTYVCNPAVIIEDENGGFLVIDTAVSTGGFTG